MAVLDLSEDTKRFISELFERSNQLDDIQIQLSKLITLAKDTRRIVMATQAEVDAITAQLEAVKTQVGKIGTDLADYINDNPSLTVEALRAKAEEVAASLQAVDDILPEATP